MWSWHLLTAILLSSSTYAFRGSEPLLAWKSGACEEALIVTIPGLKSSDFAHLDQFSSLRQAFERAERSLYHPYLEPKANVITRSLGSLSCPDSTSVKSKHITLEDLQSYHTRRAKVLQNLDAKLEPHLNILGDSYVVIITPSDHNPIFSKRQLSIDDEFLDNLTPSSISSPWVNSSASPIVPLQTSVLRAPSKNATGILDRYTFVSPVLIFGTGVILFIFLPVTLLAITALTSIDLPKGLEQGKWFGGNPEKKDQ